MLKEKLEGFQYEILRYEPSPKIYSNITIRKKDQKTKFTLTTLESSLKKKREKKSLASHRRLGLEICCLSLRLGNSNTGSIFKCSSGKHL